MLFRFFKKVDKAGKMFIPKVATNLFGREFYFEIHEDKIILVPIVKNKLYK
jgi:hypothetical protein